MLHIVNKAPFESDALQNCLRFCRSGDVIVLIENAVAAGVSSAESFLNSLQKQAELNEIRIYALHSDVESRGLSQNFSKNIALIDYEMFVDLTIEHVPNQTWS